MQMEDMAAGELLVASRGLHLFAADDAHVVTALEVRRQSIREALLHVGSDLAVP